MHVRWKSRSLIAATLALTLGLTTACGGGNNGASSTANTLVVATSAQAPSLDPTNTLAGSSMEIYLHVFDSLVAYDENAGIIPDLANNWTISKDKRVYTFALAKGVKFQDGSTMTSADVVASIKRAKSMGEGSDTLESVIDSISAKGEDSVILTLKRPYGAILAVLANPLPQIPIMPAKYANKDQPLKPPELIGTGPYKIGEWKPDQYTLLKRFDGYTPANKHAATGLGGNRIAKYRTIKWVPVEEAETRLAGLERGEFQYAESLPLTSFKRVEHDSDVTPYIIKNSSNLAFWLNQNDGQLLSNKYLRQAIVAALDDKAILNVAASGEADFYEAQGSLFWPQQREWYDAKAGEGIYNHPDPAKVKSLLAKAQYHGQVLNIVTNHAYPYMYSEAVETQRQLKKVGINAKLKVLDWASATAELNNKTGWDMFASSATFKMDPTGWYDIIAPNAPLAPGFTSQAMRSLLEQGAASDSPEARQEIYRKVQQRVWTDVPTLIIGKLNSLAAASADVHGYRPFFVPRFWSVGG